MPLISRSAARNFTMHGAEFTALAAPSSGATQNAVWTVCIDSDMPGVSHRISAEEVFVCLAGRALAQVGDERHELSEGDALIIPPHMDFSLTKVGEQPFRAVVVLPVGSTVQVGSAPPFTPPWAQ